MKSKEALEYLFGLALFNVDDEQHKKCREANKIIQKDLEILGKYENLYETIKQKRENARNDRERKRNDLSNSKEWRDNESIKLYGEIEAYTDILCLIESSGELDEKQRA